MRLYNIRLNVYVTENKWIQVADWLRDSTDEYKQFITDITVCIGINEKDC